jgi:4-diphosphocytidyl-2-C-methyl-D-erythritol kinase
MPLPTLPMRYVVIVKPQHGIATADAYGWVAESRMGFTPTAFVIDAAAVRDWTRMAAIASNDFDAVIFSRFPDLARAAASLRQQGAIISILAGSGSSVIGIFEKQEAADQALAASPIRGIMTRTATAVAPVEIVSPR